MYTSFFLLCAFSFVIANVMISLPFKVSAMGLAGINDYYQYDWDKSLHMLGYNAHSECSAALLPARPNLALLASASGNNDPALWYPFPTPPLPLCNGGIYCAQRVLRPPPSCPSKDSGASSSWQ